MKLLVGMDGSEEAEEALAYATTIADAVNGAITAVHAVNPAVFETGGADPITSVSDADERLLVESVEEAETRGMDLLAESAELAANHGHEIGTEILYGDPATEIADYADSEGFDAIYVGHQGRSERADLVVGSVATELIERATVPVTVVRR